MTGAAGGIGTAIARRLHADGLDVTLCDLASTAERLDDLATTLDGPALARACSADVTDRAAVEAAVAAHVEAFGAIDVMVANAGIAITAGLLETTTQQWDRTMAVNVRGVFNCYSAAARQMVEHGTPGRLIGAASVAAHRAGKLQGAYSASKFAVRGLTQAVAQELAEHGITANCYSPGVVHTPMWESIDAALASRHGTPVGSEMSAMVASIPLGRLQVPDDVAGVVSFLASRDAAYITGQSLVVDGGMWFS
ncbi:SDR family oxidoreductase [Kineococcus gynurae]|uniref:SDR family oxidoreductase n=1 Tax=Kineococcus gynurae TaxID=452979 RepID=UPI003D7D51BB